ncbi:class I SAM-dependent methyltransferase [Polynucleobacter sp. AP-Sanab-80-C2]|uniref:class I SAM-dependent methyltransferase n=1 Tax=Polynucleobacter sp. AP-Sanab-80-C2 TaxID=3108274 RepID=UPI002B2331E8|nr:class I SAM-dependent methyltransferase [Polynucleobacter sp. AP-Sanab-80-C2]MEA9598543.1 class I SAM-dependent methyltransferase [Polynucleobacter sp. AP-Sanab-80-C2]
MQSSKHGLRCAFCNAKLHTKVMDFGEVALAGGFLSPNGFQKETFYPLRLFYCEQCYGLQVVDKVDAAELFQDYFYFSSSINTLKNHFKNYATEVVSRFLKKPLNDAKVLEFGCNDGVLLRPLADLKIGTVIGVDPAANVVKTINDPRIKIVNSFFNLATAKEVISQFGKVDMVIANNVYAHISDMQDVTWAIHEVLNEEGVFIFEVHYLGKMMDELQYDMIYHEHLYYHSLLSLKKHFERYRMLIFDVEPVSTHAGSMRYYVCKEGSENANNLTQAVQTLANEEIERGYNRKETFLNFSTQVNNTKLELMALIDRLKDSGKSIVGYGASGRANTLIQYCGLGQQHLDYVVDDAPIKQGFYTPNSHLLIRPSTALESRNPPDYVLIFAWSFLEEIMLRSSTYLRNGGKFIIPLPKVKIISAIGEQGVDQI